MRCNFPVVDWRGVGSNPAGDIYFHFEFFAPSPFRTGQRSRCKWNQACPFTWSHSCFRPQIWFIIQGLVYKYLQYSFNRRKSNKVNLNISILLSLGDIIWNISNCNRDIKYIYFNTKEYFVMNRYVKKIQLNIFLLWTIYGFSINVFTNECNAPSAVTEKRLCSKY